MNIYASDCMQSMKLIRILALNNLKFNRRVFVKYVKCKDNVLAHALSRFQFKRFWDNAPESMNELPDAICEEIYPVEKVWFK